MSKFQQKAEAHTKQTIGQMLGDELWCRKAKSSSEKRPTLNGPSVAMTRASSVTNVDRSSPATRSAPSA